MANNVFKIKRTSISGRAANTSTLSNPGELALNITDGIMYSTNGSSVFEVGANLTSAHITNSLTFDNDRQLRFKTVNSASYAYFVQQSDDNFVFYTTTGAYVPRPVFSIYANSGTSSFSIGTPVSFTGTYVSLGTTTGLSANGSLGGSGQVLTSNGSATYWSTVTGGGSVNTASQYTWTNTHTFSANVSFSDDIALNTNNAIYFGGLADANWRMARNSNTLTKWIYTSNTIDIVTANSPYEGFAIGLVAGATYFETGYLGTYIKDTLVVGNTLSNVTINSTAFTGTANNSNYLGGNSASDLRTYTDNKSGNAYSNAVSYTDNKSGNAYSNAVSYTDTVIGNVNTAITSNASAAYSNAVSYVDNKSYVNTSQLSSNLSNYVTTTNLTNNLANYQTTAGLSDNVATLAANSATYLGNSSGTIANIATWITSNASSAYTNSVSYTDAAIGTANAAITGNAATAYTNAVSYTDSKILTANSAITGNAATAYANATIFASNASNINTGTLAEARLPYRMDQNVRTTDSVTFGNITVSGNLTVDGTTVVLQGNTVSFTDNMLYLNQGIQATITNVSGNGTYVTFTANNNYSTGWDVSVTGVNPSSYNGSYNNIFLANATHFVVANTNTDSYVSGGVARGKTDSNPDLGFAAGYNDGTYHHAGFFRDASDGIWKVFDGYLPEPDTSVFIDTTNTSFHLANFQANVIYIGNTSVYSTVNTTNFTGTANNTLFVGSVASDNVVSNAQLQANLANYQTTAGLSSNVATLTANNTSFVGSVSAANVVSNAQLQANLGNYQTTAGLNANIASYLPTYTGVVNASTFSIGSSVTANSTKIVIGTSVGVEANGSIGSANQVLTSNGTTVYWANASGGAVANSTGGTGAIQYYNGTTLGSSANLIFDGTSVSVGNTSVNTVVNSTATIAMFTMMNRQTVSDDYTIPTSTGASMIGPITVATGKTLTVAPGARLVIL